MVRRWHCTETIQQLNTGKRVGKGLPVDHVKRTDHGELAPVQRVDFPGQRIVAVAVVRSFEMIPDLLPRAPLYKALA
ncbi:MAG: hypothetical protein DWQ28_00270 [Proteobacteria bacterium]|nr:MAG: hypothetical protein DWQ28_00270 [Pseudomonadota bacterium]